MAVDISIPVSNVNEIIGTAVDEFDNIRLYSANGRGGTYTLLQQIALVGGQTEYKYTDTVGANTTWYKVTFYNSASVLETPLSDAEPFPAARSLMSLKQLRQKVVKNFGGKIITPEATAANSITAAELIDGSSSDWLSGWHLFRPDATNSADYDRRVNTGPDGTGIVTTFGAAYVDETPEQVELLPLDIDFATLNEKINDGLFRARYLYRYEFGTTPSQKQYQLPAFVEDPGYVAEVWHRYGSTADQYIWRTFDTGGFFAKVRGSAYACILDISPGLGSNDVIGLDVWRAGEPLASEDDTTNVHPIWAEAVAMVSVLQWLINRDLLRHGSTKYGAVLPQWEQAVRQASKAYGQLTQLKVQLDEPMSGFPEV